tara:strand:- start:521 stop:1336 length:816 start_codon:yes stop_codon:yes gene_type:complete
MDWKKYMINNSKIWIVSDVDGTLMDHFYDLTPAKEAINWLKGLGIPIILCTSKTKSEVKIIRNELNLKDPYIVENGGAIYGEYPDGKEWEIVLGKSYKMLEKDLNNLSENINFKLRPLNTLSDFEANKLTGLEGESLTLMRDRHWSMPFLNPPETFDEELKRLCEIYYVDIFKGNRMSHLLSKNSNKGKAIKKLLNNSKNLNVQIVGLGDSPNDLPLLKNSNFKIVVSGIKGPNQILLKQLNGDEFSVSEKPHGNGWKDEIFKIIPKLLNI